MAKTDSKIYLFRSLFMLAGLILIAVNFMNFFRNISSSTDENVFVEMYSPFYIAEDIDAFKADTSAGGTVFTETVLRAGSIIVNVNGKPAKDSLKFFHIIRQTPDSSKIEFLVYAPDTNSGRRLHVLAGQINNDNIRVVRKGVLIRAVTEGGASDRAGIHVGDIITKINGKEFKTASEADRLLRNVSHGGTITYEILRKNRLTDIDVKLARFQMPFRLLIKYFVGFVLLVFGLFLGIKRPGIKAARLLAGFFILMGYWYSGSFDNRFQFDGDFLSLFIVFTQIISILLYLTLLFHSSLYFPKENYYLTGKKYVVLVPYIISLILIISSFVIYAIYGLASLPNILGIGQTLYLGLITVWYIIIFLIHRKQRTVEQKKQSRPIGWMFFIVLLVAISNTFLISIFKSVTLIIIVHFSILLIPIVYLYVIGRYHLLDLEIRVKRNIQYFIISLFRRLLMLTVLVFSVWGILNIEFDIPNLHMTGTSIELLDNPLSVYKHELYEKVAVLLLVGFAIIIIYYINKAVKKLLDTKYYRTRFDYRRASKELSEILTKALTVDDLARYIVNEAGELIHLKRAGVIFFKDESEVCGQDYYGVQSATLIEYCNYAGKSIADAVKKFRGEFSVDYLPDMMKDIFLNCGFKHVIPIRAKDKVVGALFVGEKKSEVSYTQEDIEFISSIASQAAVAIENAFLIDDLAHQERMKHELSIAREIQMASLPEDMPSVKGLDISGLSIPALEVGGDFYDFLSSNNENEITVIVGDVSGKGTSAALYMSKTQGILRTLHEFKMTPLELFARANRLLYKYLGKTSFVTAVGASINIQSKKITIARAGHEPIFYYNSTSKRIERLVPKGIVLGVSKTELFKNNLEEISLSYKSGDVFLFVTDGVLEARNNREVDFDEERLLNIFAKSVYSDAEKIRDNIVEAVQEFAGDTDQFDDITVVVVKVK